MQMNETQVQDQMILFDAIIESMNLEKLGYLLINMVHDYERFNYIKRLLRFHGIQSAMYHPERNEFYGSLLERWSIIAYADQFREELQNVG